MRFKFDLNNKEFMNLPIEQLSISNGLTINVRALGALKRHNVDFVRDIFEKNGGIEGISKINNIGKGTYKHIVSCLVNTYLSMLSEEEAEKKFKDALTVSEAVDEYDKKRKITNDRTIIWKSES